jgi:succinate dehydrogenase flavin-adding protein (antitoxin of CptAB toxin-antitoxin module)
LTEQTVDPVISDAMSELGIDPSKLDASEETEVASENKEVEASTEETEGEAPKEGEASDVGEENKESAPDSEEKEHAETEVPKTAKEIQEIEAAKQALEQEKLAFKEEMQNLEKEFEAKYHEKIKTHDEMDAFFSHLEAKDPELFDLLKGEFQEHQKQYSNPVIDQIRKETQELKKELSAFKSKASDEVVNAKLDAEMNQVKSTLGKEAEAAGVKIDWQKVEDMWADNPKLGVESAVYALYGANISKAMASKAKVAQVEKKVAGRPAVSTAGTMKGSNAQSDVSIPSSDVTGWVKHFANQLKGKA